MLLYPLFEVGQFIAQLPIAQRIMLFGVLKHTELNPDMIALVQERFEPRIIGSGRPMHLAAILACRPFVATPSNRSSREASCSGAVMSTLGGKRTSQVPKVDLSGKQPIAIAKIDAIARPTCLP